MTTEPRTLEALSAAVFRLLRPLVRLLLRYGMPFGAFADIAKRVYVDVADDDFRIDGRKQTVSRVSILTGLSRKEVRRVQTAPLPSDAAASERYNRAARVIGGWVRDESFAAADGRPVPLPIEGSVASFTELVRLYGGDVPTRAVLDELCRVGAAEESDDGSVRLLTRAYVPRGTEREKLEILGTDVAALTATIEHNLHCPAGEAFFQRKVSYDNVARDATGHLRRLSAEKAQALLESLNTEMAAHDLDENPNAIGEGGRRVLVGIYYYEEDADD